jgi:hypothetical protein
VAKSLSIRKSVLAVAAGLAVAVLPLAAAAPAVAAPAASASASATASQASSEDYVLDFYDSYSDAVSAGDQPRKDELRATHLTSAARSEVASWEEANGTDGVLHAQNAPVDTRVISSEGAAGTMYYELELAWGDGGTTQVLVRYSNVTNLISGISNVPA